MDGNQSNASDARIKNDTQTWKQVNRKIFRNEALNLKIKILLWTSLI